MGANNMGATLRNHCMGAMGATLRNHSILLSHGTFPDSLVGPISYSSTAGLLSQDTYVRNLVSIIAS